MSFRQALDDVVILVPGREPEPVALTGGAAMWTVLEQPCTSRQLFSGQSEGMAVTKNADTELDGLLAWMAGVGAVDRMPG